MQDQTRLCIRNFFWPTESQSVGPSSLTHPMTRFFCLRNDCHVGRLHAAPFKLFLIKFISLVSANELFDNLSFFLAAPIEKQSPSSSPTKLPSHPEWEPAFVWMWHCFRPSFISSMGWSGSQTIDKRPHLFGIQPLIHLEKMINTGTVWAFKKMVVESWIA